MHRFVYVVATLLLLGPASLRAENLRLNVEILTYLRDEPLAGKKDRRAVVDDAAGLAGLEETAQLVDRQSVQSVVVVGKSFEMMELRNQVTIQLAGRIQSRGSGKYHVELRPAWREVSSQPSARSGSMELDYDGLAGQPQIHGYLNRELAKGRHREFEYTVTVVTIERVPAKEVQLTVEYLQLDVVQPEAHGPEISTLEALEQLQARAKVRQHECVSSIVQLEAPFQLQTLQGTRTFNATGKVFKHSDRLLRTTMLLLTHDKAADRVHISGRPLSAAQPTEHDFKFILGQTVVFGRADRVNKGEGDQFELRYKVTVFRTEEVE